MDQTSQVWEVNGGVKNEDLERKIMWCRSERRQRRYVAGGFGLSQEPEGALDEPNLPWVEFL